MMLNYIPNSQNISFEKFINSLFDKQRAKMSESQILRSMPKKMRVSAFKTLQGQHADEAYGLIFEAMMHSNWNHYEIAWRLAAMYGISFRDAVRIAKTETQLIANRAREIQYIKHGNYKNSLYIWDGIEDIRTSRMCHEIRQRTPVTGLPLMTLKNLVRNTSTRYGNRQVDRDWSTHPNCRSYLRLVR